MAFHEKAPTGYTPAGAVESVSIRDLRRAGGLPHYDECEYSHYQNFRAKMT